MGTNMLLSNDKGVRVFEIIREAIEDHLTLAFMIDPKFYQKNCFTKQSREKLWNISATVTPPSQKTLKKKIMTGNRSVDLQGVEISPQFLLQTWVNETSLSFHHQLLLKMYFGQKYRKRGVLGPLSPPVVKEIA
eukprot:CAMPEP_0114995302 /NCGR_PEP_ID=MMETSP0216-20121206/13648_1 /TAXON_ID=223996 /ORGANISM="Protocruzia adherens, Strain Boccale" /LENGTH=133 /DNA_ID=CAMNT_0002359317 /DNA_START=629 /DNA_END=1026 /DNA_ORIENTATION=+